MAENKGLIAMEEGSQKIETIIKESGQSSKSGDSHLPAFPEDVCSWDTHNISNEWLLSTKDEARNKEFPKHYLRKVIPIMRRNRENDKYFDPSVVSIGPNHHKKKELDAAEKLKPEVASKFISNSGRGHSEYYKEIFNVIGEARSSYPKGSTDDYDDQEFAHMMFLDGCFVVHLMDSLEHPLGDGSIVVLFGEQLGYAGLNMLVADILLLENQLPFVVLKALMRVKYPEDGGERVVNNFLEIPVLYSEPSKVRQQGGQGKYRQQPLHLLELVLSKFLGEHQIERGSGKDDQDHWHKHKFHPKKKEYFHFFRSATELKAKGIHFRPSKHFGEISFFSHWLHGELKLPPVLISSRSKQLFLNLMAYETISTSTDLKFSTYIYFLDKLIDGADDVKELRSKKILYNSLGSDEEVAKAINYIGTEAFPALSSIQEISERIQEHYDSRIRTWLAEVVHDHFSSPWSVVAFLTAIFAVMLTAVQTYFAVFPPRRS